MIHVHNVLGYLAGCTQVPCDGLLEGGGVFQLLDPVCLAFLLFLESILNLLKLLHFFLELGYLLL
jgi:hypothetical protein